MILDERGFDAFMPWAQRAKDLMSVFGNPPSPASEDQWQHWGASLGLMPTFPLFPSPYHFEDWREWVRGLNRVVSPAQFTPWTPIPDLAETGVFSLDILTLFYLTIPGTLTLNGALPTGWSFVSPNLSHAGAVLSGPTPISFTVSYPSGLAYTSNTFTVQGL